MKTITASSLRYASGKTVLILGAGPDQLPMYQTAQSAGARVIGADANPAALARSHADRFLNIQSRNAEDVVKLLGGEPIDAVISPGSDSFHGTLRDLSVRFNLPNPPSVEALRASMDKGYFSKVAQALGLCTPNHCQSDRFNDIASFAQNATGPQIVKPSDASGSKGLSYVERSGQLEAAFKKAQSFSVSDVVIAEEYIAGDQFGVETFFNQGRCVLLAVSKRNHTGPPRFLISQHRIDPTATHALVQHLKPQVEALAQHLFISNGPINFDVVQRPNGQIVFLEMGARLSGNGFPGLVEKAFHINTYDWALRAALGLPLELQPQLNSANRPAILHILSADDEGVFHTVEELEALQAEPAFAEINLFVSPGATVRPFRKPADRVGTVLLCHDDEHVVQQALCTLRDKVRIRVLTEATA